MLHFPKNLFLGAMLPSWDQYMNACLTDLQRKQEPTETISLGKDQRTLRRHRLLGPRLFHARLLSSY